MRQLLILITSFFFLFVIKIHVFASENKISPSEMMRQNVLLSGYFEWENYLSFPGKRITLNDVVKSECHAKIDCTVGDINGVYGKGVIHGYFYAPITPKHDTAYTNRLIIKDAYVGLNTNTLSIKGGIQVLKWGNAHTINPTSYFSPYDFTESLLKDPDEFYRGIPLLTCKILIKDFAITFAGSPVGLYSKMPERGSIWSMRSTCFWMVRPDSLNNLVPVPLLYLGNNDNFDLNRDQMCYGFRLSGLMSGFDFAVSAYHGPDRDTRYRMLIFSHPASSMIFVKTVNSPVTSVGTEFAFNIKDFTLFSEGTYSFDKILVTNNQSSTGYQSLIERAGFIYYTVGLSWIYADDLRATVEYIQGFAILKRGRYRYALLSDILYANIEKKFFDSFFVTGIDVLYNTQRNDWIIIPKIGFDIQNGLLIECKGIIFNGDASTLFGMYNTHDMVMLRIRYSF